MKPYFLSFAIILTAYIVSLMIIDGRGASFLSIMLLTVVIQIAANTVVHFAFCVNGGVAPFALPLMWVFCALPLYIYCYGFNTMPSSSFFGRGLEWLVLGLFGLLPVVLVSILTAGVFCLMRLFHK